MIWRVKSSKSQIAHSEMAPELFLQTSYFLLSEGKAPSHSNWKALSQLVYVTVQLFLMQAIRKDKLFSKTAFKVFITFSTLKKNSTFGAELQKVMVQSFLFEYEQPNSLIF